MNWLDLLIVGLLLGGFFWSFRHGFIMEIIYFVAALGGLLGAFVLYPFLKPLMKVSVDSSLAASSLSFGILFVIFAVVVAVLGLLLHKFIYMIKLGIFDRLLGGIFGIVKVAMVISVVLVMFVGTKGEDTPKYVKESVLCDPILTGTTMVMKSVPPLFETFHEDYGTKAVEWMRATREEVSQQ